MELFKYCKSIHMNSAVERGCVQIGTLSRYRNTDEHGGSVADVFEGTKLLSCSSEITSENMHTFPGLDGVMTSDPNIPAVFCFDGPVSEIRFENNVIGCSTDFLIFSASAEYSEGAHNIWLEQEGYDACYKILSARLFFRALTRALGPEYKFLGFNRVVYAEELDVAHPLSAVHPALVKRQPQHFDQAEIRAIWSRVDRRPIEVMLFECTDTKKYICAYKKLSH